MPTDLREHALTCLREDRIMAVLRQVPFEHLVPLADLLVEKNIEFALNGPPAGEPQNYDVPVYAMMKGDPMIDKFLADFAFNFFASIIFKSIHHIPG